MDFSTMPVRAADFKLHIAAYGLFYAGKSSLLNMLANSLRKELFPTCSLGEAFVSHQHETPHYVLMDTPNLDMLDDDGNDITPSLQGVDVAILVHAPGPLEAQELAWLQQVKQTYGAQTNLRLVVALTHRDKSHKGSAEAREIELMAQIKESFDLSPISFSVSNSFFAKGSREDRPDLMLASNLPAMRQHLNKLCAQLPRVSEVQLARPNHFAGALSHTSPQHMRAR